MVTADSPAGSTYQTRDGASKRTKKLTNPSFFNTPAGPSPRACRCIETRSAKFGRDGDPNAINGGEYV